MQMYVRFMVSTSLAFLGSSCIDFIIGCDYANVKFTFVTFAAIKLDKAIFYPYNTL